MAVIRIKICCISSLDEARMAVAAGASALGLVGEMPSGPGVIGDDLIREIAGAAPPGVATFLLTSRTTPEAIVRHQQMTGASVVQIVDALTEGSHADIRRHLPGIKLVQVIHVTGESSLDEALQAAETADALLLDSGNPQAAVKELGGTGRIHNWDISRRICEQAQVPVFLAGGLRPDNAREAIERVQPFGLDICSGVRTNGALDPVKLEAFVKAVRG
ncbi:MAG: phosphoribosylanthranilate isomerase [Bacteroidia bacterium]|nr:phosphoribosylanthranilate isomerase [Bacteroidia bacterium]